jgi:hypothetical protein
MRRRSGISSSCSQSKSHPLINSSTNSHLRGTSSFEILKEAYWPGELLIECSLNRIYRITDASYQVTQCGTFLVVECFYIDYDGKCFGTVSESFHLSAFRGVQYINELAAFPLKYHPQQDEIKARLLKRGRNFAALQGQHYKNHAGIVRNITYPFSQVNVDSRVMVRSPSPSPPPSSAKDTPDRHRNI